MVAQISEEIYTYFWMHIATQPKSSRNGGSKNFKSTTPSNAGQWDMLGLKAHTSAAKRCNPGHYLWQPG
jgi:hypothetical protein